MGQVGQPIVIEFLVDNSEMINVWGCWLQYDPVEFNIGTPAVEVGDYMPGGTPQAVLQNNQEGTLVIGVESVDDSPANTGNVPVGDPPKKVVSVEITPLVDGNLVLSIPAQGRAAFHVSGVNLDQGQWTQQLVVAVEPAPLLQPNVLMQEQP